MAFYRLVPRTDFLIPTILLYDVSFSHKFPTRPQHTAKNRTSEISASAEALVIFGGSVLQLYLTSYAVRSAFLATATLPVLLSCNSKQALMSVFVLVNSLPRSFINPVHMRRLLIVKAGQRVEAPRFEIEPKTLEIETPIGVEFEEG